LSWSDGLEVTAVAGEKRVVAERPLRRDGLTHTGSEVDEGVSGAAAEQLPMEGQASPGPPSVALARPLTRVLAGGRIELRGSSNQLKRVRTYVPPAGVS
jgi:hypothetical protein